MTSNSADDIIFLIQEIDFLKRRLAMAEDVISVLVDELNDLNEGIRYGGLEADITESHTRIPE